MKYMAAVLLLTSAMSAQVAPSTNKRHLDIPAISRAANGAIILILMSDKEGHPVAQGSGFLVSKDGRVVTNYHVIKSGSSAVIKLPDGAFFPVEGVLVSDKARDVAIIKAHGNNFRALALGDSGQLQVGEEVVAIGSPLSLESTVSNGIVSGIRTVEDEGGKFLQITVPISPGSSGGPLFNMAGEVVGITTSHLKGGENLNFAIPINAVKPMLLSRFSKVHSLPEEAEPVTAEQATGASATTLTETLKWMQDTIHRGDLHNDFLHSAPPSVTLLTYLLTYSSCNIHVTRTVYKKTDSGNTITPGFEMSFNLKDIDPNSIFVQDLGGLVSVRFDTTNDSDIISYHDEEFGTLMLSSSDFTFWGGKDYPERFKTAFQHAVELCGGKPAAF
jgi:hypothetical protein